MFWAKGLQFSCQSCGYCCRGEPGYVFLSQRDLEDLTCFTKMAGISDFVGSYCRIVELGVADRISLIETSDNNCIFWNQGCTVYPARPLQCRTYPFWPAILASSAEWTRESCRCPGMNSGKFYSGREIADTLRTCLESNNLVQDQGASEESIGHI